MTSPDRNMTSYSAYYEENLYKLQNGVLNIVKELGTPFYLTGGTALSRGYYKHRYSDDLDFFVNNDSNFSKSADRVIDALSAKGYSWDPDTVSQIIEGTPRSAFDRIKWIIKPSWEQFQKDIKTISRDMLKLGENSLR